jgi:tricorn protease
VQTDKGARKGPALAKAQVRVGDWALPILPEREWRQMFADAWRMHRDALFDPAMRGLDWTATRAKYAPLLDRLGDRADLDDLLGQMMGELGVLHSQARGAETRKDAEAAVAASLGASFERVAGGARIARIWRGDSELPGERAPLLQPGVDLREGDLILAINGRPMEDADDIAELLENQAGQQVLLDYRRGNAAPERVVATPVAMDKDATLRYSDWVQGTRHKVEQTGAGRIGYLHLRAMTPSDIADFAREFYANVDRDALIVDVRRNRGGNIDSWVIEKLMRRAWMFWQPPGRKPYWNMQQTFRGHLVVLADQLTYSDGETFSAGIKALGLAPVIGQRTAGAGVWLSDGNRLSDNGMIRAAETPQFAPDGRWLVEGHGVSPDIAVDNLPHATWRGEDAQLSAALGYLERKLREQPIPQPQGQPIPSRGTNGGEVR